MEEKEIIKKIRSSLRANKSPAEILSALQEKGYKLAYASALLEKAQRPRKILTTFSVILVLFFLLIALVFFSIQTQKINFITSFAQKITGSVVGPAPTPPQKNYPSPIKQTPTQEVTEQMLYSIISSLNLQKTLHKNPLTGEHPVINLNLKTKSFYIDVGDKIKILPGKSSQADIELISTEQEFLSILNSKDQKQAFKKSLSQNKTITKILAGKMELFAKGYKTLYDDWA